MFSLPSVNTREAVTLSEITQDKTNIRSCLERQEVGDAELFASLFKDKFVYDRSAKKWYVWRDHYWEVDELAEVRWAIANTVAAAYAEAGAEAFRKGAEDLGKSYLKRAGDLWTKRRIDNVLALAADVPGMSITGKEWDQHEMYLAVKNGMIDLRNGEPLEGKPYLYIRSHLECNYPDIGGYSANWEKFISEFCEGVAMATGAVHEEVIGFMRRFFGYCLTGKTGEHKFVIMYGKEGRNGKGTLLETLHAVLGKDLSSDIPAKTLMFNPLNDSEGATPFRMSLKGKRLVWASEPRDRVKLDNALIKLLSGGDTIGGRNLFEGKTEFPPTHKLVLLTNGKPSLPAEDAALWERVIFIPFGMRWVDDPKRPNERLRIKDLDKLLLQEVEGILSWLVRGCLEWQEQGLNVPKELIAATQTYRDEEDTIKSFVEECLEESPALSMKASEVYELYTEWCQENEKDALKKNTFGQQVSELIGKSIHRNDGSYYEGIQRAGYTKPTDV